MGWRPSRTDYDANHTISSSLAEQTSLAFHSIGWVVSLHLYYVIIVRGLVTTYYCASWYHTHMYIYILEILNSVKYCTYLISYCKAFKAFSSTAKHWEWTHYCFFYELIIIITRIQLYQYDHHSLLRFVLRCMKYQQIILYCQACIIFFQENLSFEYFEKLTPTTWFSLLPLLESILELRTKLCR